ncbi:hypothetical protein OH492_28350 [Vibrio chagasii]|nr:hypothetical protein [Vibrio chagasii]
MEAQGSHAWVLDEGIGYYFSAPGESAKHQSEQIKPADHGSADLLLF